MQPTVIIRAALGSGPDIKTAVGLILAAMTAICGTPAAAAPVVFSVGGSDAASIQPTVDSFRAALGNPSTVTIQGRCPAVAVRSTGMAAGRTPTRQEQRRSMFSLILAADGSLHRGPDLSRHRHPAAPKTALRGSSAMRLWHDL